MAQAVTLMMASRGCSIFGIGNGLAADVAFAVPAQRFHVLRPQKADLAAVAQPGLMRAFSKLF